MSSSSELIQSLNEYLFYTPGKPNENELKSKKILHSILAEMLGTMFLVLVGCGSCMGHGFRCAQGEDTKNTERDVDIVRIALAFGLAVATLAQSIGHISGCNINPAVTVGLVVGRKMSAMKGLVYIIAQCAGAVIGAGILQVLQKKGFPILT